MPGPIVASAGRADLAPLLKALALVPVSERPRQIVVHTELRLAPGAPPLSPVAYHRSSGSFLVDAERAPLLHESIWLHELAHGAMAGARPPGFIGRRLIAAFEEGVADYFAAVRSGSPRLGSEDLGEIRDLSRIGPIPLSAWAALGLPGAFSSHRFGGGLAAALFRLQPENGPLLSDLLSCLRSEQPWPRSDAPRDLLSELCARCPARSRSTLDSVLSAWVPQELYSP